MCETLTLAPGEREIPLRYANQIKLAQRHARHERDRIAALPLVHQRLGRVGICARTHARSTLYNLRLFGGGGYKYVWGFVWLTAAQDQRTRLAVHRKVAQLHWTGRFDGEPAERIGLATQHTMGYVYVG